jgi:hypothetical protein
MSAAEDHHHTWADAGTVPLKFWKLKLWAKLYIRQGTENQDIQGAQNTKLPPNQWPNKEMGKWIEQNFFRGRSQKG